MKYHGTLYVRCTIRVDERHLSTHKISRFLWQYSQYTWNLTSLLAHLESSSSNFFLRPSIWQLRIALRIFLFSSTHLKCFREFFFVSGILNYTVHLQGFSICDSAETLYTNRVGCLVYDYILLEGRCSRDFKIFVIKVKIFLSLLAHIQVQVQLKRLTIAAVVRR